MAITAALVKELREKTGVGMMECKKALTENGGDIEKSIVWLRERGLSRAAKKAGRTTAEGLVEIMINDSKTEAAMVEVNCETDFVSKNDDFRAFAQELAGLVLSQKPSDVDALNGMSLSGGKTVKDALTDLIAKIGENMQVRRFQRLDAANGGMICGYIHGAGRIGALVAVEGEAGDKTMEFAKDVCMHVAASSPRYLSEEQVDSSELEQEKEIARKKLIEEKKPEDLIEKILNGQMKKFYKEICLLDQPFVKDPDVSVGKLAGQNKIKISSFIRFGLGDGIEKKQEDFAAEVAAQVKG